MHESDRCAAFHAVERHVREPFGRRKLEVRGADAKRIGHFRAALEGLVNR
jgi:hypothetical protein